MASAPVARAGDAWAYVLGGALVGAGIHELNHQHRDYDDDWRDDRHGSYQQYRYYDDDWRGQHYRERIYYPRRQYIVQERRTIYLRGGYQSSPRYHKHHRHHNWR